MSARAGASAPSDEPPAGSDPAGSDPAGSDPAGAAIPPAAIPPAAIPPAAIPPAAIPPAGSAPAGSATPEAVADRLHSAAIHLLRRLRLEDAASGLTAPRLSALSVIVFGGPLTLGALAAAEQVRPPTMSRIVTALEREGLVTRLADPDDGRQVLLRATPAGERLLAEGRARRTATLARRLAALPPADLAALAHAAELLAGLARPER